jgi:hypothetical protein
MKDNFEKQVQQKLAEMKMSPSEPVWRNVEIAIQKKNRRRIFFWFILAVAVTGILMVSLNKSYQNNTLTGADEKTTKLKEDVTSPIKNLDTQKVSQPAKDLSLPTQQGTAEASAKYKPAKEKSSIIDFNSRLPRVVKLQLRQKKTTSKTTTSVVAADLTSKKSEVNDADSILINGQTLDTDELITSTSESITKHHINSKTSDSISTTVKNEMPAADTMPTRSSLTKSSKWKFSVQVNGGVSSIQKGSDGIRQDALVQPVGMFTTPSTLKKGAFLSAGISLSREIGENVHFITGMEYSYINTSRLVGNKSPGDTVIQWAGSQLKVNSVYVNARSQSIRSNYHFISIPALVEFRFSNQSRLSLQTGINFMGLVSTNAVAFSSASNVYFQHRKAVTSMQLLSSFGLQYKLINNKPISVSIGPSAKYGLSNMFKNGSERGRLFFVGLQTTINFNK